MADNTKQKLKKKTPYVTHADRARWRRQRPRIKQLFLVDNLTQDVLRDTMKLKYGFHASSTQYKNHIQKWHFHKTLPQYLKDRLLRRRSKHYEKLNNAVLFTLCGREITDVTLCRESKPSSKVSQTEDHDTSMALPNYLLAISVLDATSSDTSGNHRLSANSEDSKAFRIASRQMFYITCNFCEQDFYGVAQVGFDDFHVHLREEHGRSSISVYTLGKHSLPDCSLCPPKFEKKIASWHPDDDFGLIFQESAEHLPRTSVIEQEHSDVILITGSSSDTKIEVLGSLWASQHRTSTAILEELLKKVSHQRESSGTGALPHTSEPTSRRIIPSRIQLDESDDKICDQHCENPRLELQYCQREHSPRLQRPNDATHEESAMASNRGFPDTATQENIGTKEKGANPDIKSEEDSEVNVPYVSDMADEEETHAGEMDATDTSDKETKVEAEIEAGTTNGIDITRAAESVDIHNPAGDSFGLWDVFLHRESNRTRNNDSRTVGETLLDTWRDCFSRSTIAASVTRCVDGNCGRCPMLRWIEEGLRAGYLELQALTSESNTSPTKLVLSQSVKSLNFHFELCPENMSMPVSSTSQELQMG